MMIRVHTDDGEDDEDGDDDANTDDDTDDDSIHDIQCGATHGACVVIILVQ